ncbi:RagB/SusD family nutrient uptake outer membrane protein [Flavivirga amylovorans]|uniref:RagB/SusD family nutrient uptake outer membrane protein n=1 Tax=Flavivirga amylovorans TaxID=870486 RepID=A0ABT8WY03_9FLAO|nr:RagB/SusD family nutrient uptake outer membrane protein [Flavivirga amylovorans]MDO5986568.1 RagB/SusD family nutrient uptake outer membrane protein [Flavivirga amylovorans]
MKKTYIYSIVLMAFVFFTTSCEDKLEEELFNSYGSSNFPTNETAEILLAEAYADYARAYNNHRMGWAIEMPTPAMQYRSRRSLQLVRHNLSTWTWSTQFADPAYFEMLTTIFFGVRTANDAIGLISTLETDNIERRDAMVAEAKVLRALAYFNMVRLWGGMPIIDKAQTLDDDLFPARASIPETYAFIVQGLQEAIPDLPTRSGYMAQGIPAGHITKGVAQGILAKVYLTMAGDPLGDASNLQEARNLLEAIINSGEWGLVQSATPYKDLWDWQNEFNNERMFDIQKESQGRTTGQNLRMIFGYMTPPLVSEDIWASGANPNSRGAGLDGIPPEYAKWYESHDSGPRYQWTIVTEFIAQSNFGKFRAGDLYHMEDGRDGQAHIGKYRALGAELEDRFYCPNNFPVLRYADILLMHSEVTNELGAADYTGINATRERAGLPALSGLSQDDFRDAVFLERELELAYEQNLLFDMRRRGFAYCQSRLNGFFQPNQNETSPGAGDGYQVDYSITNLTEPHRMLYPYPPRELASNPNLEQNPGY